MKLIADKMPRKIHPLLTLLILIAAAVLSYKLYGHVHGNRFPFPMRFSWSDVYSPSGPIVIKRMEMDKFSQISIGNYATVALKQAEKESIEIETHEDIQDKLEIKNTNSKLKIGLNGRFSNIKRLHYTIYYRHINNIEISGAVTLDSENKVVSDQLTLKVSGASKMRLDVDTGKLYGSVSGASKISLGGKAENASFNASGASSLMTSELDISGKVQAEASGASKIDIGKSSAIDITASGASKIQYLGQPEIKNQNVSGSSRVVSRK